MKARILLAEGDSLLRQQITEALRKAGHEVFDLAEPDSHETLPEPSTVDLLVLDLDLQSVSSWDLYSDWKAMQPRLRAVAMTGEPNRFGVARAVGLDALIEKPVEPSLVVLVVASVLEERASANSQARDTERFDFRYLTRADARYWRGLRGRYARARQTRLAPDNVSSLHE